MDPLNIALVGYGYWGPNLARNINNRADMRLACIVDGDAGRIQTAKTLHPDACGYSTLDRALNNMEGIDAVVIATPPETHYDLGLAAIAAGKHVLMEKPLTLQREQADILMGRAEERGRVLMVDHVYCYSAPARRIKHIIDQGELGELLYVDSTRINLGLFQQHCDVIWDLAVHDFSLLDYFFPKMEPLSVMATATKHFIEHVDTAHINVTYLNAEAQANIHVNWLSPVKVRQMIIAGKEKSIVWNDMDPVEPIKVYDSGATLRVPNGDTQRHWQMEYRRGDVWAPRINNVETLSTMLEEFHLAIKEDRKPATDGAAGSRVVTMVKLASKSAEQNARRMLMHED